MTILHLTEQERNSSGPAIVRKRPMDRLPVVEIRARTAETPRGMNIFSLARVISKRAVGQQPLNRTAV